MAPVLKHSNATRPFVVEVDASEICVGAYLLPPFGDKPKLQPLAFYSKKLSSNNS